jgi:hypothetical protein
MEFHLATETLSFFSIWEQIQQLKKVTSLASLKMGSTHGIFKA